jgi:hypothetical protein
MKSVVFTFGRMNPPTTGHQLLVNKLVAYARSHSATPRIYLSHSVGPKDPLQYDKKIAFARAAFGALVKKSNARTFIEVLKQLDKEGFKNVTMFVGSDRVVQFNKLLQQYNGKEYNFDKIEVKSAGERDPDADDVSGMSASKMRALAKDDKVTEFLRGAPNTLKAAQAKNMFKAVRKALLGEDVMEYGHNERFLEFIFESDMKEDDMNDLPSDGEISKHFDSLGADDLELDDADAMMLDILLGDEEDDKEDIEEAKVLSIQQRQKLAQRMKSMSKRLARLRQIKAKQMPAAQRLRMRARKAALMILRKRATGRKNLEYSSLSKSQRIAVDTALVQRFGKNLNTLVGRLATRLMPRVRKHAQEYMKKSREETKESFVAEAKEKEGSAKDVAQDKIQAAKRGMSVSDWEKTKADAAHDSPLNIDPTRLDTLSIDPTKNDREAPNPKQGHLHLNRKLSHYARSVDEGRKGTVDQQDSGDTNIMYQLRKVLISRGNHEVEFADKSKHKISVSDANKMLDKFAATRMPADKHEMTIQAGKSLSSFKNVLAHGIEKQKKKISLGGKNFKEFYLGVGRSRTVSAYDNDEPPGVRRVAEAAKDEDRPENPNRSRPLSQKLDLLLRLGLSDAEDLQKYRRALRSSKKAALQSPEMREKLADLLDKLIDLTTQDPATYSRVRYRVQTKEAYALLNKAEKSGVDVDIIFEVFARGYEQNEDINEAFNRVNSFIAGGKAAEMDKDLSEKRGLWDNIHAKRERIKAGSGERMRKPGSKGAPTDAALKASQTEDKDPCWSDYKQVGMKMKNGRQVPNCVPKEEAVSEVVVSRKMTPAERKAHASYVAQHIRKVAAATPDDKPAKKTMKDISKISHSDYTHQPSKMASVGYDKHESTQQQKAAGAALATQRGEYAGGKKGGAINRMSLMKTKDLVKLARGKKVKEEVVDEVNRRVDVKLVKVKQPDGKIVYRKEHPKTAVQMEATHPHPVVQKTHPHPTGKVPYAGQTNKELRDALPKKVKAASEAYTGSEPASNNTADPANRFVGTNSIRQNYANVTPGQGSAAGEIAVANFAPEKVDYTSSMSKKTHAEVDQSKDNLSKKHFSDIRKALGGIRESNELNESFSAGFELAPFARDYGMKVQSAFEHHPEVQEQLDAMEATYKGKTVPLNKPMKGDVKKSKVYVDPDGDGKAKKVNFGDKKLSIKKGIPARKKSYCARSSGQGNLTDKSSANYWSRRAWDC